MYFKEISIPQDVSVEIFGNKIKVKGQKGEVEKKLEISKEIKIEKIENKIKISSESERRKTKSLIGTTIAHIRNAIDGVTKGFTYKLKIIYSHFPITVKVEGNKILIQNFLGERIPRVAKIIGNSQVKVEGQEISVRGADVDEVSQTAANIEQACRIVGYDKRIFHDGIFITSKGE